MSAKRHFILTQNGPEFIPSPPFIRNDQAAQWDRSMKATDRATWGTPLPLLRLAGVVAACLLCAVGRAQAPPGKVLIADVIPQGNRNVPTQKIISIIKTHPGGEYKEEVVAEDVRRLYETHLFANVRVAKQTNEDGRVVVYFQFVEFPSTIQEIIYQGANHLKTDDLESITGLRKGVTLNPIATQLAKQAILKKYQEKGRLTSSVDILEGDKPGDTRIVFSITEGPVVKVRSIDFTGNTFVSGGRLATQINSSRPFLMLIGGDFNPLMADLDATKLEEYYKSFGYHDIHVSREVQWDGDQRHVKLIFHVHEGQRYRVAKVDLTGVPDKERDELLRFNRFQTGDLYDQHKADADKGKMKDYIGYGGREASVQEVVYFPQDKPGEVVLHYEVQERPPARVGQIYVIGNEVTKQNVILRQVPLYPGQPLTYPDMRLAEKNLARLNIFEMNPDAGIRPTVTVLDPDGDSEFKDIQVNVQETRTGSLMFGVGVNSDAGLNGSIVLNERNFDILRPPTSFDDLLSGRAWRGAGQEFRIEAVPGTDLQRYTVSFREPSLFDSPYSFSISGYYYNRIFNEYTEERVGSRVTFSRKLNQFWSVNAGFRIEEVGVHNVAWYEPYDIQQAAGENFLVAPRVGVTRDSRDSFLRPTEGSLVDVSFEEVLGDYTFPVVNIEGNKYFTIYQRPDGSGRHVLAARSQVGIAGSDAPVFERFYAGGFRSMRGFEFRGVGPDINGFKIGGDFLFLNSLEYQIPIKANDQIYLVGFIDSGTVERRVEIEDYRVAAGFGVRLVVPMLGPVPIALDFGFPIVKAPSDRDQIFSFWVGFFH
jgi:outer membrane protein assembly complex protein YaeT